MVGFLAYKLGIFLANCFPRKVAYRIATLVAAIHFYCSKKDRSAVIDNVCAVTNKPPQEAFPIARSIFENFAKYLVDFSRFAKIDDAFIKKFVRIVNIEHVTNALKKGRGVLLLSAHLGNWELAGGIFPKLGHQLNVVALDHENPAVNNIFVNQRLMMGTQVISTGLTIRKCFAALKRNECLALLGDRDFSNHGIEMPFFGKNTLIPKGPATFCLRCGAPIVPVFMVRNADDTFTFIFEKEIVCQKSGDFEGDIAAITEKTTKVIEQYIRKHPEQWCMFRRFWIQPGT
jgi:KDO2-lipid IV(A) lauroyltransferase